MLPFQEGANQQPFLPSTDEEAEDWDFQPHPEINSIYGPPKWHEKYEQWHADNKTPDSAPIINPPLANLNPDAQPYTPYTPYTPIVAAFQRPEVDVTPTRVKHSAEMTTGSRAHNIYEQRDYMTGPPAPVAEVVARLRDEVPREKFNEDGSIELNIQWAIDRIGYGHLEKGRNGRAIIRRDSPLFKSAINFGLPYVISDWLKGRLGCDGPTLRVSAEAAGNFWRKERDPKSRYREWQSHSKFNV